MYSHKEVIGEWQWVFVGSVMITIGADSCVVCAVGAGEAACADGDALSGDQVSGAPVYSGTSQDH